MMQRTARAADGGLRLSPVARETGIFRLPGWVVWCGSMIPGGDGKYYLLLDEVQQLGSFEAVLNGYLRKDNVDVYVTGSNSKFLSSDIITEFAGRGDEVHVLPLSFSEFFSVYEDATPAFAAVGVYDVSALPDFDRSAVVYDQINDLAAGTITADEYRQSLADAWAEVAAHPVEAEAAE